MLIKKMMSNIIGLAVLALMLLFVYYILGFVLVSLLRWNTLLGFLIMIAVYLVLIWWFLYLKRSDSTVGIYGALEVTLGLVILTVTSVQAYTDTAPISDNDIKMYLAVYTSLYIGVRGLESMYKKWESDIENHEKVKYSRVITYLFNKIRNNSPKKQ